METLRSWSRFMGGRPGGEGPALTAVTEVRSGGIQGGGLLPTEFSPEGVSVRGSPLGFNRQQQLLFEHAAVTADSQLTSHLPQLTKAQLGKGVGGKSGSGHRDPAAKMEPSSRQGSPPRPLCQRITTPLQGQQRQRSRPALQALLSPAAICGPISASSLRFRIGSGSFLCQRKPISRQWPWMARSRHGSAMARGSWPPWLPFSPSA
jgi:hypothetical protein